MVALESCHMEALMQIRLKGTVVKLFMTGDTLDTMLHGKSRER